MANVIASVLGGDPKRVQAETVEEAKNALGLSGNYTAAVNGDPAEMDDYLEDNVLVTFTQAVKGG